MTAEVAVLNNMAVALAADSAASASTGGDVEKIYATNKLFTLSKIHPVGIMFYGAAEFLGVPFETIVKLYREKLGRASHPTVQAYLDDFVSFLSTPTIFNEKREKGHVVNVLADQFDDSYKRFFEVLDQQAAGSGRVRSLSVSKLFAKFLDIYIDSLEEADIFNVLQGVQASKLEADLDKEIKRAAQLSIIPTTVLTPQVRARLSKISGEILLRQLSDMHSGIVVAGFGEEEIFPSLVHVVVDGTIYGRVKIHSSDEKSVGDKRSGGIYSFAQGEMVYRFMEGVDTEYQDYVEDALKHYLKKFSNELLRLLVSNQKTRRKLRNGLPAAIDSAVDKFSTNAMRFRRQNFVGPIVDVLNLLPKEELATMAEGLVNVTSIRRRMSTDKETVGGPVDVAVISKGDGFVWLKRKHYFNPELNPHFMQKYFTPKEGGHAPA